jgi:hypothetical protein
MAGSWNDLGRAERSYLMDISLSIFYLRSSHHARFPCAPVTILLWHGVIQNFNKKNKPDADFFLTQVL